MTLPRDLENLARAADTVNENELEDDLQMATTVTEVEAVIIE